MECVSKVATDGARIVRQLPPGDANDAPARRHRRSIAGSVTLERRLSAVVRIAVELDDQPRVMPDGIGLNGHRAEIDTAVRGRRRQPGVRDDLTEARFELTAGDPTPSASRGKRRAKDACAGATRMLVQQVLQFTHVEHPAYLCLLERLRDTPAIDRPEVAEGSGDRSDRYPAVHGAFERQQ